MTLINPGVPHLLTNKDSFYIQVLPPCILSLLLLKILLIQCRPDHFARKIESNEL